ncbi:MAG: hypothetical protein N2C12_04035, partial [Planctomycetales bacterium]
ALERLRARLDDWLEQTGDVSRPLEEAGSGLDEVRARIKRSRRWQLQYILEVLAQQRNSPDISDQYKAYLDQVEPMIRLGMESK